MDNEDILKVIDVAVKKAVDQTVSDLRKNNMIKENGQTPFQKVETLLYNYKNYVAAVKDKEEQIAELRKYGVRKHSSSGMCGNTGYVEVKSEAEKAQDQIDLIEYNIQTTRNFISVIDDALNALKDDPYYQIIPMKYFERMNREEIAEELNCDGSTVNRNKNRLINLLQIRLFSDQVIQNIFAS